MSLVTLPLKSHNHSTKKSLRSILLLLRLLINGDNFKKGKVLAMLILLVSIGACPLNDDAIR